MSNRDKRIICVLGMHRSGTSTLTRALEAIGLSLGDNLTDKQLLNATDNPKGFFEDKDVNDINISLLKRLGQQWDTLTPISPIDIAETDLSQLHNYTVQLMQKKLEQDKLLAIKNPRTAQLLFFWKPIFEQLGVEVIYILAYRHPMSVAHSLEMRNQFTWEKSYGLWLKHNIPAIIETTGQKRFVVNYDNLMDNPTAELRRIAKNVEISWDTVSVEAINNYINNHLEKNLRHTRYVLNDFESTALPKGLFETCLLLEHIANDQLSIDLSNVIIEFQRIAQYSSNTILTISQTMLKEFNVANRLKLNNNDNANDSMICFESALMFGEPKVFALKRDVNQDIIHESYQLLVHGIPETITVHVDFAYPNNTNANTPFLFFIPGGNGISNTDFVCWAARKWGIACMSYDWPGRHRSLPLSHIDANVEPFHLIERDFRFSYAYAMSNTAANVYRHWLTRSEGKLRMLSGSSWGAVQALLVASAFHEHDIAYIDFGCGDFKRNMPKRSYWDLRSDVTDADMIEQWRELFDPINFVQSITRPIIMATATNDKFFSLDMFMSTWSKIDAPKAMVLAANCDHNMRELNYQPLQLLQAAAQANETTFTGLPNFSVKEVLADDVTFINRTAWLALGRENNHVGRLWHKYTSNESDILQEAQDKFITAHAPLLRVNDDVLLFISFQTKVYGELFTFATELSTTRLESVKACEKVPDFVDLCAFRYSDFEDRIAYRSPKNIREEAAILRFSGSIDSERICISGVFPLKALTDLNSTIHLTIEIIEELEEVFFCLLQNPETATEIAWGKALPIFGVKTNERVHCVIPLREMIAIDTLSPYIQLPDNLEFEPSNITAACFFVKKNLKGAIKVLELRWQATPMVDYALLKTKQEVQQFLATQTINTTLEREELKLRLQALEPWRYRLVFSNGVDSSTMQRKQPWVDNIHNKVATLWPWVAAQLPRNYSVLDVGCGLGHHRFSFRALGCEHYVGIESSNRNVNIANTLLDCSDGLAEGDAIIHASADMANINETFDLVICLAVMNNMDNIYGGMNTIRKAMTSNSILVIENLISEKLDNTEPYLLFMPQGYSNDSSLRWIPTLYGLEALLHHFGFNHIEHKIFWRKPESIGENMVKVWTVCRID